MTAAARGVVALIIGNRRAAEYFDLGPRGLAGSFIAFLVVMLFEAVLPLAFGAAAPGGTVFRSVATVGIVFAFFFGASALVLRQFRRPDALVPLFVTGNWANVYVTLAADVLIVMGFPLELLIISLLVIGLIVQINIARLIMTLTPLQIVMFLIAVAIGGFIGLIVAGLAFPPTPADLETLGLSTPPA